MADVLAHDAEVFDVDPGLTEPDRSGTDFAGPVRIVLCGAGHVGSGFLAMVVRRRAALALGYGVDLRVCAIAEYGGCAVDPDGLDLAEALATLRAGRPLGGMTRVGRPGMTPRQLLDAVEADFLLEATPVNLVDGEPGLGVVRAALSRGMHVVLADKAPLALAYRELASLSDLADGWGTAYRRTDSAVRRPRLRFSATVAGALPVINIGRRDLAGDRINRIEAVFNGTSQSILRAMEAGGTFDDALADARKRGIVEADPSLDVDGLDAACKLVITANAVLGLSAGLDDVVIAGIRDTGREEMAAAAAAGRRIVPLCLAERDSADPDGKRYSLSVQPTPLPADHPLARLSPDEMGVAYYTDHVDRIFGTSLEPGPEAASAAMLRDVLDIVRSRAC